jgi:transmembrane sensor
MNVEQPYWDKIAAYLSGHMSNEQSQDFEKWLQASPENEALFKDARAVWKNSGVKRHISDHETQSEWQTLEKKIDTTALTFWEKNGWLKIAAAIAILALALYPFINSGPDDITITSGDQVATIYLPDSSKVWLNTNSSLTYSDGYGIGERTVRLQGEGYFDVRHASDQKFFVTTKLSSVEVTGTAFNVKEDSSGVVLTVEKGSVIFTPTDSQKGEEVSMNERARIHEKGYEGKTEVSGNVDGAWRKQRNPIYEEEKLQGSKFLSVKFSWRKNAINQSVIDGVITNKASLATYRNVILAVTYNDTKGIAKKVQLKIEDRVPAEQQVKFTKRLLDIFKETQDIKIEVVSAQVVD